MLAICFGIGVFSSVLWLFYAVSYLFSSLGDASLSSLGLAPFSMHIALIILPIFLIWLIFGFVMQFFFNKTLHKNLYHLFQQMKKNQDYTDVVARLILESERQTKDSVVLGKIDILIADLNEILSEIIYKTKIASKEQIDMLWQKAQNGGKWAFAKVIIEVWQNQTSFLNRVLERANSDVVLSGSILEFCARYLSLVALLEKHDKDKVFLNLIEAGVLGKVFSIFAPIDDEIKKRRGFEELEKIKILSKEEEKIVVENKDDFSMALERSFVVEPVVDNNDEDDAVNGFEELQDFSISLEENVIEDKEPKFETAIPKDTSSVLSRLEKTLEVEEDLEEKSKEDDGYPFGNFLS